MIKDSENKPENKSSSYKIEDAMKVTDDIFVLNKEKKYHPGAFVHGLVFALEVIQQSYKIPHQKIADLKRGCRKYFNEIKNVDINNKTK
jgi:hypothetical protein